MRTLRIAALSVFLGCGTASPSPQAEAVEVPHAIGEATTPAHAADPVHPDRTATQMLAWAHAVGWEPRQEATRRTRPEGSYLVLEYALPYFEPLARTSAGLPLRDKPLIVRHANELCDATLHEAVQTIAPDRLLIRIDPDLDASSVACLARLDVPNLFLSTCHHDGALPRMDGCRDGDAQLALLAGSEVLRSKVRGLAIGFGDTDSWRQLGRFTRLSHLVLRGDSVQNATYQDTLPLCELEALDYVDALNAYTPGAILPLMPVQCILGWRTLKLWRLDRLQPWLDQVAAFPNIRCHVERLEAYQVSDEHRRTLEQACPRLMELSTMNPLKRCRRTHADETLTCEPIR